ncbi:MAG: cytochrome c oxidase subunit 3 family protein [Bacteroidales bacterium]|jgi:cytochrome c oxidase subunit 3|nr:cytochrome c oxidase subunit 3 family protein [Bacteroidales bacterium]NLM93371.1 cytochrome c oxidase subunit 3 family protein [Bacteroidales bacterium]
MIEHRDDLASKMGMWLFIFTELLLFGMLFVVYAVYRSMHPEAFKLASEELDVVLGTFNTVILLISSMTVAMSITSIQKGNKKLAMTLLIITLVIAVVFLVNKYFEWGSKFEYGFNPGGEELLQLGHGTILFFGLYFVMTGIHAIHILIGVGLFIYVLLQLRKDKIHQTDYIWLENTGLYWHLVDLIWIFLFPLLYLIH